MISIVQIARVCGMAGALVPRERGSRLQATSGRRARDSEVSGVLLAVTTSPARFECHGGHHSGRRA